MIRLYPDNKTSLKTDKIRLYSDKQRAVIDKAMANQAKYKQYQTEASKAGQEAQQAGSFGRLFKNTLFGLNPFNSEGRSNITQGVENVGKTIIHPVETAKKVSGAFFGNTINTYKDLTQARKDKEALKQIEDNNKIISLYANEKSKHPELADMYDKKMATVYNENKKLVSEVGGGIKDKTTKQLIGQSLGTALDIMQVLPVGSLLSKGVKFVTSEGEKLGAEEVTKLLADNGIDAGSKEASQFLADKGITVAKDSLPKLLGKSALEGSAWMGAYGGAGGLEQNKSLKETGKEALKEAGIGAILAPALALTGVGLGKALRRGTPENKKLVDETANELENLTNKKATPNDKNLLAHSFELGKTKEDIVKNAKKVAPEITPEPQKPISEAVSKEKGITELPKTPEPKIPKELESIQKAKAEGKSFEEWANNIIKNKEKIPKSSEYKKYLKEQENYSKLIKENWKKIKAIQNKYKKITRETATPEQIRQEPIDRAKYQELYKERNKLLSQKTLAKSPEGAIKVHIGDKGLKAQLKELWDKAKPVVKPEIKPKETPKLETGKTPSKVAKSIEAKAIERKLTTGFKSLAGYNKKTVAGQAERVANIINQGEDVISQHLSGEKPLPEDVNEGAFITGVDEYLTEHPNKQLQEEFANSPLVSETSKAGQTIRFLREREPDSATAKLIEAKKARIERAKKLGKSVERNKRLIKNRIKPRLKVAEAQQLLNKLIC